MLHPDSAVKGHSMLVAARHVENFCDLTDSEIHQLGRVQRVCERALLDVTRTDRAILMKLGIQTPHFHLHIYPVSSSLDRTAVMKIIDGKTRVPVDEQFIRILRDRLS